MRVCECVCKKEVAQGLAESTVKTIPDKKILNVERPFSSACGSTLMRSEKYVLERLEGEP